VASTNKNNFLVYFLVDNAFGPRQILGLLIEPTALCRIGLLPSPIRNFISFLEECSNAYSDEQGYCHGSREFADIATPACYLTDRYFVMTDTSSPSVHADHDSELNARYQTIELIK